MPVFDNSAMVENKNAVHPCNVYEAMRDEDDCDSWQQFGNPTEDRKLRWRVQRGSRFVKNQDARLSQQGTSQGESLPLATGQLTGGRAQGFRQSVWERCDKRAELKKTDDFFQLQNPDAWIP
jgi:hypothetical protein